jgi:hypothetical protein
MLTNSSTAAAAQTAREAHALGEDARFWRINAMEALWNGVDIDPRPGFWDTSVPLRDRAPAVRAKLARTAGLRLAHMVAGERSFPAINVGAQGYKVELSDSERDALQALADEIKTAAKLSPRLRALIVEGLKTGTAVSVQSLSRGVPRVQILPAKWCEASRDASGAIVRLVVQYKTPGPGGKLMVYRREIGDGLDLAYEAISAETLASPNFTWSQVPVAHKRVIEFVAVVWTRNLCEAVEESHAVDGHALAEGLEDELAAIDLELSQLLRTALYNGEPQMVRTGSDPEKPAPPMGAPGREASAAPAGFSWANSILPSWMRGGSKPATQKAPGKVWDLATGSDAKLLESTGAGAQIIQGALDRLVRVATDSMGVVMVDPATIGGGDLSARALAMLHGPQLDTADNLRVEYGDALVEIVGQLLRLCAGEAAARDGVRLASWEAARTALAKCWAVDATGARAWNTPAITLAWGEYFEPSWSDISAAVDATTKAVEGRVMSRRAAVGLLAPLVGTPDAAEEMDAIDGDEGASREAVRSTLGALRDEPADDAPTITEAAPAEVDAPADVAAGIVPETAKDPAAALNGAQVDALRQVVLDVSAGTYPRETGAAILTTAFPLTEAQAQRILAAVVVAPPAPATVAPPSFAPKPDAPPPADAEEPAP